MCAVHLPFRNILGLPQKASTSEVDFKLIREGTLGAQSNISSVRILTSRAPAPGGLASTEWLPEGSRLSVEASPALYLTATP